MQIKEPAVTEVTLINTIDPIPIPSIKEEMQSPSPAPAPVIQKAAPKIPKIKGIPEPKEGITDEPVKDIGRIGLPRRSDIGRKEMASFSKKALGTDDVPLPDRSFIEGEKGCRQRFLQIKGRGSRQQRVIRDKRQRWQKKAHIQAFTPVC